MIKTGVITNPERRKRAKRKTAKRKASPVRQTTIRKRAKSRRRRSGTATHAAATMTVVQAKSPARRRSGGRRVRSNPEMMIGNMTLAQLATGVLGAGAGAFAGTMAAIQINTIRSTGTKATVKAGSAFAAMALGAMVTKDMDAQASGLIQGVAVGASAVLLASALGDIFGLSSPGAAGQANAIPTRKSAGGVADTSVDEELDAEIEAMDGLVPRGQMAGPYADDDDVSDDEIDEAITATIPTMGADFSQLRHEMQGLVPAHSMSSALSQELNKHMGYPQVQRNFPPLIPNTNIFQ